MGVRVMTFLYAIGLFSLGVSLGFAARTIMTSGKRAGPNETRTFRSVESRYVTPDSNLLRSGGHQPRPGNHRPAVPKTGSGVQILISPTEIRKVKTV
jgi:hypothetical protein